MIPDPVQAKRPGGAPAKAPVGPPVNVADYERLAADRLDPGAYGYFAGGAWDERTLRDNVDAYRRWDLLPRVLVDVSETTTATTVLGTQVAMPLLVAPTAFQRLADPDGVGEPAMARAAAGAGTIMCVSTLATSTPSEVAEAAPGAPRWLQVYCFRDMAVTRALMEEAAQQGYGAFVLTVDAPRAGRRERDLRTGFAVPPEVRVPSVEALAPDVRGVADIFALIDASLDWDDLADLVAEADLPVLVKGLVAAEDARRACELGVAGLVVSNHGGRQLDGAPATLEALPDVVEAVEERVEVLVDGGVRRGTDVVKALALGARAVLAGRAPLWGLAVRG
ncbi:MAG TPA: alpha-hydroxy acid oxidase, partial [Thermoleophilaceae bacterium]|nr:alpha-hydroxy acid oxidase [Thermoleophilaceae bacterium]